MMIDFEEHQFDSEGIDLFEVEKNELGDVSKRLSTNELGMLPEFYKQQSTASSGHILN